MRKLIPDNVPEILKLNGVKKCKDDAEFFSLLRHYIIQNVNKIFDEKDRQKKENALYDAIYAIGYVKDKLYHPEEESKRISYTGEFGHRYYIDIQDKKATQSDVQKVEKFGEENGYPAMVLRRHNGKVTKFVGSGKDKWQEAIAVYSLKEPYNENFLDLLKAVEENDIYGDYKE